MSLKIVVRFLQYLSILLVLRPYGIIYTWEENFTLNIASVIMFPIFSLTCLRNIFSVDIVSDIFFHGHYFRHIFFFMNVVSVIIFSGYGPDLLSEISLSIDLELQTYLLK